jgi:hypothetical protein
LHDGRQRFEIGLQLVGLLRCADRHQLTAVDAQVNAVAGLTEGGDGIHRGRRQRGPRVPRIGGADLKSRIDVDRRQPYAGPHPAGRHEQIR